MANWLRALAPLGRAMRMQKEVEAENQRRQLEAEKIQADREYRNMQMQEAKLRMEKLQKPDYLEDLERQAKAAELRTKIADLQPAVANLPGADMDKANQVMTGAMMMGVGPGSPILPTIRPSPKTDQMTTVSPWADIAPKVAPTGFNVKEQRLLDAFAQKQNDVQARQEEMARLRDSLMDQNAQDRMAMAIEQKRKMIDTGLMRDPATIGAGRSGGGSAPKSASPWWNAIKGTASVLNAAKGAVGAAYKPAKGSAVTGPTEDPQRLYERNKAADEPEWEELPAAKKMQWARTASKVPAANNRMDDFINRYRAMTGE